MARASVAALLVLLSAQGSAQSDLDAFMAQVLSQRDENWKKLAQYTLAEDERFELTGTSGRRLYGFSREYLWFPRDEVFVRSPTRADGVAVGEADRRRAEERWIQRERNPNRDRDGANEPDDAGLNDLIEPGQQPRFVSSAYFMKFKFEPGHYALVGRERLLDRDVLRIEYYPERLFGDAKSGKDDNGARIDRAMNKVALITLWINPADRQILQYEFRNIDFDFLPGRSLARVEAMTASMRMAQAFPNVWLPESISMRFAMTLPIGTADARYSVRYHDYKEAVVGVRVR